MRTNYALFTLLAVFFLLADAVYTAWCWGATGHPEWTGTVAMAMSAVFAIFLQFYFRLAVKSVGGLLPEDRGDANIEDGEAEQGHFSPWSWWPFVLAVGLALMFLGLAVGFWLCFIGAPIVLLALVGWQFEYYRGNFAR